MFTDTTGDDLYLSGYIEFRDPETTALRWQIYLDEDNITSGTLYWFDEDDMGELSPTDYAINLGGGYMSVGIYYTVGTNSGLACLAKGTKITVPGNKTKAIDKLKVGDKVIDAEGNETSTFERHLYNLIGGKDGFGSDATKIIEWLANNDIGNPDYQKLIQEIAEEILKNGKNLTASEIHILIYNKLGVKSTDGILSQEQIDEILNIENEDDVETTPTDKKLSITYLSFENLCSYGKLDAAYNNGTTRQLESTFTKNINNLVELGYDRNKLENAKTNILTKIRNSIPCSKDCTNTIK